MKKTVALDSNVFDYIWENEYTNLFVHSLSKYEYHISYIQKNELDNIPDSKREKKAALIHLLAVLQVKIDAVSPAVYGSGIKYGQAIYCGDTRVYDSILFETGSNTRDAMIGSSAVRENCILVSRDDDFAKKMQKGGYEQIRIEDFVEQLKEEFKSLF